nr:hypothetical protein [Tanacetum cinerariifolium]
MPEVESLRRQDLNQSQNALFVVSTFGDGEAPDSARGFERKVLGRPLALGNLNYAVLGLGDRQYRQFCGFSQRLHGWLAERGGRTLFDPVEVDSGDGAALQRWQQQLGQLTGSTPATFLSGLGITAETLVVVDGLSETLGQALSMRQLPVSRSHLVGLHAQALVGALVPLAMREYSIASIPEDGSLQLIVRQELHPDGTLGLGSGWLTEHVQVGGAISMRDRLREAADELRHWLDGGAVIYICGSLEGMAAGVDETLKALLGAAVTVTAVAAAVATEPAIATAVVIAKKRSEVECVQLSDPQFL